MRLRAAIKLGIFALVLAVVAVIGFGGLSFGLNDINTFEHGANYGFDIGDSTAFAIESPENAEENMKVIAERIRLSGYQGATVTLEGDSRIVVMFPSSETSAYALTEAAAELMAEYVASPGLLEVLDPEGNVVFTQEDVVDSIVYVPNATTIQVQLTLSEPAKTKLAEASEKFLTKEFSAVLDGSVVSKDIMYSSIEDGVYTLNSFAVLSSAQQFVITLKGGVVQGDVDIKTVLPLSASMGHDTLGVFVSSALIAALILCVVLIVLFRLPGIVSLLSMIASLLLYAFITVLFGYEIRLATLPTILLGVVLTVSINAFACIKIKKAVAEKGVLYANIKRAYDEVLPIGLDICVAVLVIGFALISFSQSISLPLGIAMTIVAVVSSVTVVWLPRFLLKQFVSLNWTKPCLFAVKEGKANA